MKRSFWLVIGLALALGLGGAAGAAPDMRGPLTHGGVKHPAIRLNQPGNTTLPSPAPDLQRRRPEVNRRFRNGGFFYVPYGYGGYLYPGQYGWGLPALPIVRPAIVPVGPVIRYRGLYLQPAYGMGRWFYLVVGRAW